MDKKLILLNHLQSRFEAKKLDLCQLDLTLQYRLFDLCPGYLKFEVFKYSDVHVLPNKLILLRDVKVLDNCIYHEGQPVPQNKNLYLALGGLCLDATNYTKHDNVLYTSSNVAFVLDSLKTCNLLLKPVERALLYSERLNHVEMEFHRFWPRLNLTELLNMFSAVDTVILSLPRCPDDWEQLLNASNLANSRRLVLMFRDSKPFFKDVFTDQYALSSFLERQQQTFDLKLEFKWMVFENASDIGDLFLKNASIFARKVDIFSEVFSENVVFGLVSSGQVTLSFPEKQSQGCLEELQKNPNLHVYVFVFICFVSVLSFVFLVNLFAK